MFTVDIYTFNMNDNFPKDGRTLFYDTFRLLYVYICVLFITNYVFWPLYLKDPRFFSSFYSNLWNLGPWLLIKTNLITT